MSDQTPGCWICRGEVGGEAEERILCPVHGVPSRICIHGGLRRQCEPCDLADRLEQAEADLASVRAQLAEVISGSMQNGRKEKSPDAVSRKNTGPPSFLSSDDLSPEFQMVQREIEALRAQLVEAQRERDEAREQFDRHVAWATLQQGHRAARVSALVKALAETSQIIEDHCTYSPSRIASWRDLLAPSSPPETP